MKDIQEISEELFDKYGYYVDDNLSAMEMITGRSVVLQNDFMLACKDVENNIKTHWISISECTPIYGKDVLFTHEVDEWVSIGYLSSFNKWYNSYDHDCECYPTHWMYLPENP